MAITKVTLTVKSSYAPAPASGSSGLNTQSWGAVTLWDIRPWMPWDSRGLVGSTNWQGYLGRTGAMDSTQAPGYDPVPQAPKAWALRTDVVDILDATLTPPYAPCSRVGPGPYTYSGGVSANDLAFDPTTVATLLDTLVIAAYAYNSFKPSLGGPTDTDLLNFYDAYLDVHTSGGAVVRYRPQSTVAIAPGTGVGSPTDVANAANAVDADAATYATVRETNGSSGAFGPLWHPAVLLLEGWSWGSVLCNSPARGIVGVSYSHALTLTGDPAAYVWSISAGALPPGLTLNSSTGVISGTPTTDATYSFTVRVVDPNGIASSVACSIRIDPWGLVSCNNPPSASIDQPYSHAFSLTINGGSGPYVWSISSGALPDGLTLNTSTGVVTGTPTVDAVFHFTVSVVDSSGIPISTACTIRIANSHYLLDLWVWRVLQHIETTDDVLVFPPGYERALRLQLAAEFGRQYPGHDLSKIKTQLKTALASIEQMNVSDSQAIEELPPPPAPTQ